MIIFIKKKLIRSLNSFSLIAVLFLLQTSCNAVPNSQDGMVKNNCDFNPINVKSYGAKGDGKTDDYHSIQMALNQGPGKVVFFPNGNYRISQSLKISSGTEILGEGDVGGLSGSSILPLGDNKTFAIFTSNGGTLEDVIFRNIRTLRGKYGLTINVSKGYLTKVKWYNCVFQEHEVCINVIGSKTNGMYANTFRDCYFKASKLGIYCEGAFNINVIQGCGFENMIDGYVKLGNESRSNLSNSFIGNRCESVSNVNGIGIELTKNVFGFYVNGNYFENSFKTIIRTNGARSLDFSNNTYTNDVPSIFGSILINGGDAVIRNNFSLTGFILDITNNGYCNEVSSNGLLNFSNSVNRANLGIVNNQYNTKYNK